MKFGMTYDLRADYLAAGYGEEETAEFDRPDTIDAIETALQNLGHEPVRIGNIQSLVKRLAAGERWDMVFNIAEGLYGFGREAAVPALLDAYRIPYTFSDPLMLSITLHKAMAKHIIRDVGLPTPDFAVVRSPEDIARINLPYPLFAKPIAEGTGKGVTAASKIASADQLDAVCRELLDTYKQPVLIETFLPGREFTVGIVGNGSKARSIGIMEVVLLANSDPDVYSYRNKEICEEVVEYRAVDDAEAREAVELALKVWHALDCRDSGRVDLRSDANGHPSFIEINPIAGLHPEHSDLCIIAGKFGMGYQQLIKEIVDAALGRVKG
ncbi:MAG: ATP-grasp domain-containing protein [Proteobacteria bacterium]|nr:ATP-grasp domain-containing protein [Pseudomonadota bacterium]MBU4294721.1 ATP-grasp domain-containing protein [Pseudomonadota bacterium]MCG2746296.1 ATP-grasp domain-containing protein [Desulfobulbaceae bacterium]